MNHENITTTDNSTEARLWRIKRAAPIVSIWEQRTVKFLPELLHENPAALNRIASERGTAALNALPVYLTAGLTAEERKDLATVLGGIMVSRLIRQREAEARVSP